MWKVIEISQQTHFAYCDMDPSKDEVIFILYDLKEAWTQIVEFRDVKLKVKVTPEFIIYHFLFNIL